MEQAAIGIVPSVAWAGTPLDIAVDQGTAALLDDDVVDAGGDQWRGPSVCVGAVQSAVTHILSSAQSC